VHSDVYASMTGITRFMYENEHLGWKYNRTENMIDEDYLVYTHLFSDRNDYPGFKLYKEPIKSFVGMNFKAFLKNPFKASLIKEDDLLFILEREDVYEARVKGLNYT
jgi:hypothetical protein